MKTIVFITAFVCLALIAGGIFFSSQNKGGGLRVKELDASYNKRVEQGYWVRENTTIPVVTLVEYGDFESPACAVLYSNIEEAMRTVGKNVRFEWHSYPLIGKYGNAMTAAIGAEAAGRQGKFWEFHTLLFANQTSWQDQSVADLRATLITYAQTQGLNIDQFKSDLDDTTTKDPIQKDMEQGNKVPLAATPTLLLNGNVLDPIPPTAKDLVTVIQTAINQPQ